MTRIRQLITRYPIATAALALMLLTIGGWRVYQALVVPAPVEVRPAPPVAAHQASAQPSTGSAPTGKAPSSAAAPVGTGPAGPASDRTAERAGDSSLAGASPTQAKPGPAGTPQRSTGAGSPAGRRDPFVALVQEGSGGGERGGLPLPPIPPLAPGGVGPGGIPVPGEGTPAYRVAGILRNNVAMAILEGGATSRIVEPGDELEPGVRVVAIDVGRGVVRIMQDGAPVELRLGGGRKAP